MSEWNVSVRRNWHTDPTLEGVRFVAKTAAKLCRALLIGLCLLPCLQAHAQAQTLIYARSYAQTAGRLRARFPNGAIGASTDEALAMLRGNEKTEIYSVSVTDGKRSLLFSDEGTNLEIRPTGATVGASKAYAVGILREWRTTPTPGAVAKPAAIYEISLDGSNRTRRLFDAQSGETPARLNPQARKAVFEGTLNGSKDVVFVYDVSSWKLLQSWELSKLSQANCPGCSATSYGWLASGDRLFFNLDTVEDDDDSGKAVVRGAYLATEEGTSLGGAPAHAGQLLLPGYIRAPGTIPNLIGQFPDGTYLFRVYGAKEAALPRTQRKFEPFLVLADTDFRSKKQIPLRNSPVGSFSLSPSGKYLAYIEARQIPNYRTENHLWGMDLKSGEEKELFAAPPPNPPASPEPNVVFTVLGWVDN